MVYEFAGIPGSYVLVAMFMLLVLGFVWFIVAVIAREDYYWEKEFANKHAPAPPA